MPADQLARVRHQRGLKGFDRDADRIGGNQRRGAAIAEQKEGENLFQVGGLMQMQGAKLQIDRQHPRLGLASARYAAPA